MGKTFKHHPHRPRKSRVKSRRRNRMKGLAKDRHPAKEARSLRRERELAEDRVQDLKHPQGGSK